MESPRSASITSRRRTFISRKTSWRSIGGFLGYGSSYFVGKLHQGVLDPALSPEELQQAEGLSGHEIYPLNIYGDGLGKAEEIIDKTESKETFPGSHPLSLIALVRRIYLGLRHPGKDRFLRILKASKASKQVIEIAQKLECSVY